MNPEARFTAARACRSCIANLLAALAVALLSACATPARVEQMRVDTPDATRRAIAGSALKEALSIKEVSGGQETNPLWVSNISNEDFRRALEDSLRAAGLLAPSATGGRYLLTVNLLSLAQPVFGVDMTVTASVLYTLVDSRSGKEVWVRTITLPYTAAFGESILGVERLKLANEGAARENIRKLVELLAEFKPPPPV